MFEDMIEEAYAGFGQSGHVYTTDLRTLYYGRLNVYLGFTDDGVIKVKGASNEMDRPDGIICYDIKDVIGRKVSSNKFYANVFRIKMNRGEFVKDIRNYKRDELHNDVALLRAFNVISPDVFDDIWYQINRDTTIRHDFVKMWLLTEFMAKEKDNRNFGKVWREILMSLGYIGFADPSRTGVLLGTREPVVIYLDYENREDFDILPIQKYRVDPRQRTSTKVDRMRDRMAVRRNRVAKRRT